MSVSSLETWQRLLDPSSRALVDAAAAVEAEGTSAAGVSRLRRIGDAGLVAAALDLAKARRKAAAKFGEETAARLVADSSGVEMATSALAGAHKAARYVRHLGHGATVVDLCCGIGGDAMTLHAAGLKVVGVDMDPCRAWMAGINAGVETRRADVLDESVTAIEGGFHLDPARREEGRQQTRGKRLYRYADLVPGPEAIERIIIERRNGAIKLGPGVDAQELPTRQRLGIPTELELISERGRLTQAVLWTGALAEAGEGEVSATTLRDATWTLRGKPGAAVMDPSRRIGAFLFEPDPAIERARLLGVACERFGVREWCPGLGLLTGDVNPCEASAEAAAWLGSGGHGFEVVEEMAWRLESVKVWLSERRYRVAAVKTRGQAVDADEVQRALSSSAGTGAAGVTVFVLRLGNTIKAVVTTRKTV